MALLQNRFGSLEIQGFGDDTLSDATKTQAIRQVRGSAASRHYS